MSRVVLCDICSTICQGNQYFSLSAWHGKSQQHPSKQKQEAWDIKHRDDVEKLLADVCTTCLSDRLGIPHLSPVKTRETLRREIQLENPQMSGLKLLRKTAGMVSISVTCDLCQGNCMDRHLKIESGWLTNQGEQLMAELCSQCVGERLYPIVRFQVKPPKQQPTELSVR